ncbi:PROTEIN CYCLOPS [Salix viminalis]|uniref:PROTEIN CYCLOPS n=1 Tax=Salix viminalis TaxID=40686 RepID=A0A9Q0QC43_SALVM|nr:PROTEIN CYCLOPS [Salix viminalis]
MDKEGRGLTDLLYRNSSEELFLRSLMETSVGMPAPTMEMLGFKNLSQNIRADSEELFKSWLTNGENGYNSTSIAHRTRQASRRLSTELVNLTSQQHGSTSQKKNVSFTQNNPTADDISNDLSEQSISRNEVERTAQASNLYLAKAWFHSSQPMTRSRSSELRRRYVAMQYTQKNTGMEVMQNASGHGAMDFNQEFGNPNGFSDPPMHDTANQMGTFMSPTNSSSSTFNTPQISSRDKVSSVVNMLKGTLERKKLGNQIEKEIVGDSSNALYHAQGINSAFDKRRGNGIHEIPPGSFQEISPGQVKDPEFSQTVQVPMDLDFEGFVNSTNPFQLSTVSWEPSQSESSAATPVVSSAFDACDGPSNSSQTLSICETSRKQVGNDFRDRIIDNLKDDRKRGGLVRYGSIKSAGSVDKGDPTKKRRVERSRKMAEAKERNMTPATPSDMQSVLKRCENLEKEVRSLKLNLSFMNRKDSEQTKEIEDLQKQNDDFI